MMLNRSFKAIKTYLTQNTKKKIFQENYKYISLDIVDQMKKTGCIYKYSYCVNAWYLLRKPAYSYNNSDIFNYRVIIVRPIGLHLFAIQ